MRCAEGTRNGSGPGRRGLRRHEAIALIRLTRLNNTSFILNADLIKTIEERPDTTITLINGETFIVRDTVEEVVARAVEYGRAVRAFRP